MKGKWGLKGIQLQESSRIVLSTTWTGREGCTGTLQSCLSFLVPPELSFWRVVPSFCLSISAEGRNSCSLFEKVLWDLGGLQGQDQEPWSTIRSPGQHRANSAVTERSHFCWHRVWASKSCLAGAGFHSCSSALLSPELKVTKSSPSQGNCNVKSQRSFGSQATPKQTSILPLWSTGQLSVQIWTALQKLSWVLWDLLAPSSHLPGQI